MRKTKILDLGFLPAIHLDKSTFLFEPWIFIYQMEIMEPKSYELSTLKSNNVCKGFSIVHGT